jgi:hypothetical protein
VPSRSKCAPQLMPSLCLKKELMPSLLDQHWLTIKITQKIIYPHWEILEKRWRGLAKERKQNWYYLRPTGDHYAHSHFGLCVWCKCSAKPICFGKCMWSGNRSVSQSTSHQAGLLHVHKTTFLKIKTLQKRLNRPHSLYDIQFFFKIIEVGKSKALV